MSLLIALIKRYLMTPVGVIVTITHQLASTKCLSHLCCISPTRVFNTPIGIIVMCSNAYRCISPTRVFNTPIGIIGMCSNAYRCVSPTRVKYPPVCYCRYRSYVNTTYCRYRINTHQCVYSTISLFRIDYANPYMS